MRTLKKKLVFIFILLIGLVYLLYLGKQKSKIQSKILFEQKKEREILKKKNDSIRFVKEKQRVESEIQEKKRIEEENKRRSKPHKAGKYDYKVYTDPKTGETIGPDHPKHGVYVANDILREESKPVDMTIDISKLLPHKLDSLKVTDSTNVGN